LHARSRTTGDRSPFRADVEGLRAVAIAVVLLCHAGLPFAAGGYVGVDVFFVISGFLITRLLLGELERTGTINLIGFYARRARRLLPLLFVVLIFVAALSRALFSPVRAEEVSGDVVSSAFYVVNWHFAGQSVDYFAQGVEPSPLQHIWSLAIEEQFYLVWPTLILLAAMPFFLRGFSPRRPLAVLIALIAVGSLVLGLHLTGAQPHAAYFSTLGRGWELAVGAALALLGAVRLPRPARLAIGWAGLAAIAYAVLTFDSTTPFPGVAALVPTLGSAALILAGAGAGPAGAASPSRLLSLAPVRYLGRISYSSYLWHWPALIFAAALWGSLSVAAALAVIAASFVPAVLSHHWVEEPLRRSTSPLGTPRRALAAGTACTAAAAAAGLLLAVTQPTLRTAPSDEVPGAEALASQPEPQERADAVAPNPLTARDDRSQMYEDGCLVGITGTKSNKCEYGRRDTDRTMVLFGDSQAMQYFPAVERLADVHDWRLVTLAKAECPAAEIRLESSTSGREYRECKEWRERALERIESMHGRRTVLVTSNNDYSPLDRDGNPLKGRERRRALESAYVETLKRLHRTGARIGVIKDQPSAAEDVPSCVSRELRHLDTCAFRRPRSDEEEIDRRAAVEAPGARLVDVTDKICPRGVCRAVIGNALVYRDRSHLSATFAATLAPSLDQRLREADLI
jgi:peptidoglycan/LPS O-acetylase OafA/YrhL